MHEEIDPDWAPETLAIRAGIRRSDEGEQSEALYLTSSFVFGSAAQAAARFAGSDPGNVYSRFTNPTVQMFSDRLAALEGGEAAVATGSGMAAILATCLGHLRSGDHIVASSALFGATVNLFDNYLAKFGVAVTYVPATNVAAWVAALRPETRLLFVETPSNPLTDVADISALAEVANAHNCLLVVDNCFCTPVLQRPLALGAHLVIHSATKYLDGQGRCLGGAVVGARDRIDPVFAFLRTAGPSLSPFNAWVFLKGLETLSLRMRVHCENALALAHWLESHPAVGRVHYPGLASHPQHALAARQQSAFGGMIGFELADRAAAWSVIDACRLFSVTANLGDAKSTITHPATTTHGRLTAEKRELAGIREGLIRLSVGLEAVRDLQNDLARGLDRLG